MEPTDMPNLYSEDTAPDSAPPPPPPQGDQAPDDAKQHQDDAQTGVLPKDFFQGKDLKPGTECKVRIEQVMDDEVAVTYVPHSTEDEGAGEEAASPEPGDSDADTGGNPMYQ